MVYYKRKANNLGWDPHYSGAVNFADNTKGFENEMGITLQHALLEDLGHKLTLYPMEENGSRCDWDRGLAHAHIGTLYNAMQIVLRG